MKKNEKLIDYENIKILEHNAEFDYIKDMLKKHIQKNEVLEKKIEKMQENEKDLHAKITRLEFELKESEKLRMQIENSKTYHFSLRLYKVLKKIVWWRS